ncbi:MAG TPA: HipA domain-containing protein, partial [Chloroflexota bacterium]|nr:HipA domain-containing protein [Chloroflexota bacterium]
MPDGAWGRPVNGAPSTHILKPELPEYPNTVENEAFCMRLAKHLGVPAAEVAVTTIGSRKMLVVTRFDRQVGADGTTVRVHQEDFCQATGTNPQHKYQDDGGPSLSRVASIASSYDPPSLESLLRLLTLDLLVGNGDAHAKNFALLHLLHDDQGARLTLRLAPAYDVLSTLHYGDDRLAMYVDNVRRATNVTRQRLHNEAASWGV